MKYTFLTVLLIFSGWVHSAIKPADGIWRSTDDPDIGSGLLMVTQGDITVVSVFSYTFEGKPKWYLAVGTVDENGMLTADLTETYDGTYILSDNPGSASVAGEVRQLNIWFDGTQTARFTIDDSDHKSIQPLTFGQSSFLTEHFNLSDGTFYAVPDLSGVWVVSQQTDQELFTLMLDEVQAEPPGPYLEKNYISSHSTTENWMVRCPFQFIPNTFPFSQPFCVLESSDESMGDLRIPFKNLGFNRMEMMANNDDSSYSAKRTYDDQKIRPSDGYWRPEDDPAVGSGVVMVTQGDVTVVLLYSYDEIGLPVWQIASGQFGVDGTLETTLINTTGGSPIEVNGKTTATLTGISQSLVIQLLDTDLATFSIDGSEPKHLQAFNFGGQ